MNMRILQTGFSRTGPYTPIACAYVASGLLKPTGTGTKSSHSVLKNLALPPATRILTVLGSSFEGGGFRVDRAYEFL